MLIRALLIGTLLAGLTGAAVFYGLGETWEAPRDVQSAVTHDAPLVKAPEVKAPEVEAPVIKTPVIKTPEAKTDDTPSKKTLKTLLNKDKKELKSYGSGTGETADETSDAAMVEPSETAVKKVKTLMKPSATGSFVVSDEPRDGRTDKSAMKDTSKPVIEASKLEVQFKNARRITDKTARDKIYLEIFETAIDSGNMGMARRIGDKLSTPDLRQFARETLADVPQ